MDLEGWGRPLATPNLGGTPFPTRRFLIGWRRGSGSCLAQGPDWNDGLLRLPRVGPVLFVDVCHVRFGIDWRSSAYSRL